MEIIVGVCTCFDEAFQGVDNLFLGSVGEVSFDVFLIHRFDVLDGGAELISGHLPVILVAVAVLAADVATLITEKVIQTLTFTVVEAGFAVFDDVLTLYVCCFHKALF